MGFANYVEMLYTAEPFDARRAFQIGFVTFLANGGTDSDTAPFSVTQTEEPAQHGNGANTRPRNPHASAVLPDVVNRTYIR